MAKDQVRLHWLGDKAAKTVGVTWGVPWARGELQRDETFALSSASGGAATTVQSWATAYWPDGSVKWTAHAAAFGAEEAAAYSLERREGADVASATSASATAASLLVEESTDEIVVDTGALRCRIGRSGADLIRAIERAGVPVCSGATLVGLRETRRNEAGRATTVEEPLEGVIEGATLEQAGPVRAVVKLVGRHRAGARGRRWLPFTVRLYFFAGMTSIRAMHTFVYDGNPQQDYLKGIGLAFRVPLRGELYNRHLRFAGDTGWFAESPKGLETFRTRGRYQELYRRQTAGEPIAFEAAEDADFLRMLEDSPVWNGYKLTQLTPDSYSIQKRTKDGCSWIRAAVGRRARGLMYAGGEGGGLAIGKRHYWQKAPAALEVEALGGDEATATVWLWTPDAQAMDLRHYDTDTHVLSCYEGADELRSTPYGVANTSELTIWACGDTPDIDALDGFVDEKESPPLLVADPERYHSTNTLGAWSLPNRTVPAKARVEDALDGMVAFYMKEIEQRGWYGFWDYGDVMHSYDPVRHSWRYDIGGCAWQNTELAPNIWLWYMFLRSGREDIFRLAEAMTRHTSEVDAYHIGEYAGLGSRHNVLHWGCGCKEARIAMAGLHRYFYYLTADERIGDRMDAVKDADFALLGLDPMRAYFAKDEHPTHARSGPDWSAFCSNWLVQWERHEDTSYRDKMLVGIECLKRAPYRLLTGPVFGYDPKSGVLTHMGHENYGHHLMICMGGAQVWQEMADLLDDPEWTDMVAEYGAFYTLPNEEKVRRTDGAIKGKDWNIPMLATAMMAYAARRNGDRALAEEAWALLLKDMNHWTIPIPTKAEPVPRGEYVREIDEIPWISTNTVSQWSINVIVCLELIGDALPEEATAVGTIAP
ncbi:hypothetical protein MO973_27500 [Paenibacillus sp. TRM 82003]|nr:hypothetical protein [Paenibacillus sp. TRM 82003]